MTCENLICFANDRPEERASNNHVMIELPHRNSGLRINSLGTRNLGDKQQRINDGDCGIRGE